MQIHETAPVTIDTNRPPQEFYRNKMIRRVMVGKSVAVVVMVMIMIMSRTPLPVFLLFIMFASLVTLVPAMGLSFPLPIISTFRRPLAVLVIVRVVDTPVYFTSREQNWRGNCRCQQHWSYFLQINTHGGAPFL